MLQIPRTVTGFLSALLLVVTVPMLLGGGCNPGLGYVPPAAGGDGGDAVEGGSGDTDTDGGTTNEDTDDAAGGTGDDDNDDAGTDDASDTGTDDQDSDNGADTDGGSFTSASIIHRGAGGFAADPKYGIPASAAYSEDGSIQSSVQLAMVSKDGNYIWFATQDGNGFVTPQLFCINADGSGIQEFALPSGLVKPPSELWPSADGESCALIIDACGDSGCSGYAFTKSVILLATRTNRAVTTLFDARNLQSGENDYFNLQISDDGSVIFFQGWDSGVIYSLLSTGGTPQAVLAPAVFTRALSTPQAPQKFRINGDVSALVAVVRFEGPDNTYPQDVYLWTPTGVTALTTTGDAYTSSYHNDLGVSDDARYVAYARYLSSQSQYQVEVVDRTLGTTTTIVQGSAGYATFLDCDGTVIFTGYQPDAPSDAVDQLPALGTLDGSSALEFHEGWLNHHAAPVSMTSMSRGAAVLAGTWDNGEFGDPARLYVWLPGASSYRDGPSIAGVDYDLDAAAGTLAVRATVSGPATSVMLLGLFEDFESIYQLAESEDPFYTERWGQELAASAEASSVYEYTVDLDGISLDERFRLRIGVGDDDGKNFAYVDFRPVPDPDETLDTNGDGVGD